MHKNVIVKSSVFPVESFTYMLVLAQGVNKNLLGTG